MESRTSFESYYKKEKSDSYASSVPPFPPPLPSPLAKGHYEMYETIVSIAKDIDVSSINIYRMKEVMKEVVMMHIGYQLM